MPTKTYSIPQGKFLFKAKANASGKRSLYLQYVINSTPVFRTTGILLQDDEWDATAQMIKRKVKDSARLNAQLQEIRRKVDVQIAEFLQGNHLLTTAVVKKMIAGEYTTKDNAKRMDLVTYALEYNERRYDAQEITEKTRYNHEKTIKAFAKYLETETGDPTLPLSSLTVEVMDKYKAHCISKLKNKPQSVNKKLEPLSKAVSYAAKNDLIPLSLATLIQETRFLDTPTRYDPNADDGKVRYLTSEQMTSLLEVYYKVSFSRTRDFIDMFLFSFHACGLRASDVITLEWSNIDWENRQLTKILVKRKNSNTIPLSDSAIKILEHWKARNLNSRFVFNLLPEKFNLKNDKLLTKTINNQNRTIRQSLAVVGQKLTPKFKDLSMHVARHTFAVMALNDRGIDLYTISRLMGHASVLVTEKVYAQFLGDTLKKEVRDKLSFASFEPSY